MLEEIEQDRLREFIAAADWTFAKTMPWAPHFYALKHECRRRGLGEAFEELVDAIVTHGYPARWRNHPVRRYLEIDGWRYWVMSPWRPDVVAYTTVINRADVDVDQVVRVDHEQLRLDTR
jgi:hypothetical protein